MKKILIIALSFGMIAACNSSEKKKEDAGSGTEKVVDITENPDYQKGLEVVSKSDCFTCHLIDEKNIGPAWREVANKYAGQENAVSYLAEKIIKGGSGVWGDIPMLPHASFTQEDAEAAARYVLLLKK